MLRERYDPPEMMRLAIYPPIWDRGTGESALLDCLERFEELRQFVRKAEGSGIGLLVYLC